MVIKTFTKGLFYIIIFVTMMAFFFGLTLARTDIVNPWTSKAKAAQTDMQTAHAAEKNSIDLAAYQQERQLEAQALMTKANDEIVYRRQMNQVKLNLANWAGIVVIGLTAITTVLGIFLVFWHYFQQIVARKEALAPAQPRITQVYLRPTNRVMQNGNGNGRYPRHRHPMPSNSGMEGPSPI